MFPMIMCFFFYFTEIYNHYLCNRFLLIYNVLTVIGRSGLKHILYTLHIDKLFRCSDIIDGKASRLDRYMTCYV